ncbi:MAG: 5-methylcytosine-specific restriction system specificity protein McrC [Deltaproteobacteria bacterium]|jgi:5-methylcytosine-specific restriction enzyme subunit McrC|nr:5-methylcytosine-specific restriction system specificity protein McrC [Deltaproteobacteria bacterium]
MKKKHNKIKSLYRMLCYAFKALLETGIANVAAEECDNVHDLFAAILALGVGAQIKRGMHRFYVQKQEDLAGLRGKINVSETIKRETLSRGKLVCRFDEFSTDIPHNQALKSVLLLLLRHGNVRNDNKKAILNLLPYFSDVSDVDPASIKWDTLTYHRHNSSYEMLIGICRLTVKGLLLTNELGSHKLASWLQEEQMHLLYQNFLLAYYKHHHKEYSPSAARIFWDVKTGERGEHLPVMKTDVTLEKGKRRLIIDAKYYSYGPWRKHYDRKIFLSANLYQIYAYVKNSDKYAAGHVAGALL